MEINTLELLSYLGYKGQKIEPEMIEKINKAVEICYKTITPKHVLVRFKVDVEHKKVIDANFSMSGEDIWKHIDNCKEIYLLGATLGFEIEKQINRYLVEDKTLALFLDAAATTAIESYLDDICNSFKETVTQRYSCGYGDFDIKDQKDICRVLDTQRKIGVFINESCLLSPQKSVTAIIGIKNGH